MLCLVTEADWQSTAGLSSRWIPREFSVRLSRISKHHRLSPPSDLLQNKKTPAVRDRYQTSKYALVQFRQIEKSLLFFGSHTLGLWQLMDDMPRADERSHRFTWAEVYGCYFGSSLRVVWVPKPSALFSLGWEREDIMFVKRRIYCAVTPFEVYLSARLFRHPNVNSQWCRAICQATQGSGKESLKIDRIMYPVL